MVRHYILKGRELVPVDFWTWAMWFEDHDNRIVKQENIGTCAVSTICLGLDHSFGNGEPIVFETMVFVDGESEVALAPGFESMARCSTYEQALAQHERIAGEVRVFMEAMEARRSRPHRGDD